MAVSSAHNDAHFPVVLASQSLLGETSKDSCFHQQILMLDFFLSKPSWIDCFPPKFRYQVLPTTCIKLKFDSNILQHETYFLSKKTLVIKCLRNLQWSSTNRRSDHSSHVWKKLLLWCISWNRLCSKDPVWKKWLLRFYIPGSHIGRQQIGDLITVLEYEKSQSYGHSHRFDSCFQIFQEASAIHRH